MQQLLVSRVGSTQGAVYLAGLRCAANSQLVLCQLQVRFMSARKFLPLFSAAVSLTILAGCGGNNQSAGLPQGNFTNASLNGSYALAVTGTNRGGFFTMAGSLAAHGRGMLSRGTVHINSPSSCGSLENP